MSACTDNVELIEAFTAVCEDNTDPLLSFELDAVGVVQEFALSVENSIVIAPQQQQQSITSYFRSSKSGATFTHEDDMTLLRCYKERGVLDGVVGRRFKTHKLSQLRERLDELVKELVDDRLSVDGINIGLPVDAAAPTTPTPVQIDAYTEPVTISSSRLREAVTTTGTTTDDISAVTSLEAESKDLPPKKRKSKTAGQPRPAKKMKKLTLAAPPTLKAAVNGMISLKYSHAFCDRSAIRSTFGDINKMLSLQTNQEKLPMTIDVVCCEEELD